MGEESKMADRSRWILSGVGLALALFLALPTGVATAAPSSESALIDRVSVDPLPTTAVGGLAVLSDSLVDRAARVSGQGATRIAGSSRYETAVEMSKRHFHRGAGVVVLATGNGFADALAGAPLAAYLDAPLLLTTNNGAAESVRAEIARLRPNRLVVIGGTAAVTTADLADLAALAGGAEVDRIGGPDRYATAAAVAGRLAPLEFAVLASGVTFADALSAGPLAAARGGAVLLTPPDRLADSAAAALANISAESVLIAGGTGAVSSAVEADVAGLLGSPPQRLGGTDRYDTSALFADATASGGASGALLTTGADYPDAMVAAAHGARLGQPVLLMGGPYRFGHDAALARARGVGAWVQLSLESLAETDRGLPLMHTAYTQAYRAAAIGRLYGWEHPEAVAALQLMRTAIKPDGGYGLDNGWDAFSDGTKNPPTTSYLITITDHVGRALLDGFESGVVSAAEVSALVELVRDWPRVVDQPGCLAYSNSEYDTESCVHNVNSSAIWFVDAAERAGAWSGEPIDVADLIAHETAAYLGDGWWPYRDDFPQRQDVNHNAAQIEHLQLTSGIAAEAFTLMTRDPAVPFHPDEAMRSAYDPMGYLRLGDQHCPTAAAAYEESAELTSAAPYAPTTAQIALWAARIAGVCGEPPEVARALSANSGGATLGPVEGPEARPVQRS